MMDLQEGFIRNPERAAWNWLNNVIPSGFAIPIRNFLSTIFSSLRDYFSIDSSLFDFFQSLFLSGDLFGDFITTSQTFYFNSMSHNFTS
jgi:hypothetical protein